MTAMRISLDRNEDGDIRVYCTVCMCPIDPIMNEHDEWPLSVLNPFTILTEHVMNGHGTDEAYSGII